jgi:hypothetical protein
VEDLTEPLRKVYELLGPLADPPTWEILVERWETFPRAAYWFTRVIRNHHRPMHGPGGEHRSPVRGVELNAMIADLLIKIGNNPVWTTDPRAQIWREELYGLLGI